MEVIFENTPEFWHELVGTFPEFWYVWLVGILLVLILFGFFTMFVFPAYILGRVLNSSIKLLEQVKDRDEGYVADLSVISSGSMADRRLAHSWNEYAETLHPQRKIDETGQSKIVRWRATALAETYFSGEAIVDVPLKVDFYKHLPGILTGLGIIGTFLGLITGLSSFDISDPAQAQSELKNLINAVGHAFTVSAAAIALAMLFTWFEKSIVNDRHRQVALLRQIVDSMFDAGAGEEYLARLVEASEIQATQAAQIKDALVADLKEILTTLTERQMEALAQNTGQMSVDVGRSIADHLGGPIADIATAVKGVSVNQGEAVNKMLTDVLSGFSAQMQDMFGGQLRGMTDLLMQTSEAMKQTAEKFGRLAGDMDTAGKQAVEAMGERLNHAVTSMEARQQIMNKQMGEYISQIRDLVSQSQTESARKLQETLGQVGEQVAGVVMELRRQAEESDEMQGRRQVRFEESTGKAVEMLSSQMEGLLVKSIETNKVLQDTVAKLADVTNTAISGMNQGAETLYIAANDFAKAGQGVAETMRAATEATGNIKSASGILTTATTATKEVLLDYARTRDSFAAMVGELKSVTENARRDAAMTSEIVARIEAAAERLGEAQQQIEEYLKGVNDVLTKTHESFSENVVKTLREGNRQFQDELRKAVDMVSAAVRDLADTLEDVPGRRR
jgi:chorismate mutase